MAGLLDIFNNMAPEQNQGLLAAAASILQQSGPSRTPFTLGQALGTGIGAYQGSMDHQRARKLAEQEARQMAELRGFAIKDKQSDYEAQELQRRRARELATLRDSYFKGGAQAALPFPGGKSAETLFRDALAGQEIGPPQQQPTSAVPSGLDRGAMTQQRLGYANYLRQNGFGTEAQAEEDAALKLQPKVKTWSEVDVNGVTMYAPYFEDGTHGAPVPLKVAKELHFANTGGQTRGLDRYTGKEIVSYKNTMDPGQAAQIGIQRERLNFDRSQVGRPVFNAELGGFITPPTKANPNGGMIPLAGMEARGPKMTEDQAKATGWLVQAENAWKNMKAVGIGEDGKTTSAARPGFADAATGFPLIGEPIGNWLRSADRQKFVQASSSLSESLLRAATGAGVTKEEAIQKVREVTPVWGEDEATTQQKLDSIPLYIESLKARAGPGARVAARVAQTAGKAGSGITFLGFE